MRRQSDYLEFYSQLVLCNAELLRKRTHKFVKIEMKSLLRGWLDVSSALLWWRFFFLSNFVVIAVVVCCTITCLCGAWKLQQKCNGALLWGSAGFRFLQMQLNLFNAFLRYERMGKRESESERMRKGCWGLRWWHGKCCFV